MITASWRGTVLARAERTVELEGNHYFPPDTVDHAHVVPSATTSVCPWKGTASYLTVAAGEDRNVDAAWSYSTPSEAATQIRDHVAFWKGVEIVDDGREQGR
ncbi:MAG: DUF427 domain-containing protein [Phycicoccus sp.]